MTNVVWGALDGVVRPPGAAMLSGLVGAMARDRLVLNVVRGLHGRQRGAMRDDLSEGTAEGAQQNAGKKPFHRSYF